MQHRRQPRKHAVLFLPAHLLYLPLAAVLLTVLPSSPALTQATGEVTIDIGDATGYPGGVVDVPVTIQSTGLPSAVSFQIQYDTQKLSYSSVTAGPAATNAGKEVTAAVGSNQKLNVVVFGSQFSIGDGVLVALRFNVLPGATQGELLPLAGENPDAADQQSDRISSQILDGEVAVGTCTAPAAPTGVTASDGDYAGHVRISWNHGSGAAWYDVYRSSTSNPQVATVVATVQAAYNYGEDQSADAATVQQSGGCGGGTTISAATYYYWVQSANACGESALAGPDTGYRGAGKSASTGVTAAKALPSASSSTPIPLDAPVAVRLSADEPIDPASIWGIVTGEDFESNAVAWMPSRDADASSGWVVYRPQNSWLPGELVTLTAGARTISGAPATPVTVVFLVTTGEHAAETVGKTSQMVRQPTYDEFDSSGMDPTTESQSEVTVTQCDRNPTRPDLKEGVGPAYALVPQGVYSQPQRVWLPVPAGADPSGVQVYAFIGDDWFPAANVDGLLVPDSMLLLDWRGATYLGFLARHGATVQLGLSPTASIPPTSAASAGTSWHNMLGHLVLMAFLLVVLGARRLGARPERPSSLESDNSMY